MRYQIDEFSELVHPHAGRSALFSMWKAYFDESGIHGNAKVCIAAGYVGKKGPWRQLEKNWLLVLRQFRVPLEEFHAKDAVNKTGFFLPWDRTKHDEFLNELAQCIKKSGIFPVCYGVLTDDFKSMSLLERRFLTGATWHPEKRELISSGSPNKPYFVAFTECLKLAISFGSLVDRVNFFFGSDRAASEYAMALFRWLRLRAQLMRREHIRIESRLSPERLGIFSFPQASETPSLQAADLFSYLTYQHMLEREKSGDWQSQPSILIQTLIANRKKPSHTSFRRAQLLREMLREIPGFPTT